MISNYVGFYSLFKKEIDRFLKIYVQTLITPLITNIMFLGVFGGMFQTRSVGIDGVDYLGFLVPGLCVMGAITSSFQSPSFSLIISKFQNTIQDLNSYPLSNLEKLMAYILAGTLRGLLVGFLTYIATIFFVGYSIDNPILFFLSLFFVSFIFSSFGYVLGLYLKDFDKINFALNIVVIPLVYFGGVFFEISKLPGIFSKIAFLNPIFPLVDLTRYAYLGKNEGNLYFDIGYLLMLTVIFFLVSYQMTKKGIGVKD